MAIMGTDPELLSRYLAAHDEAAFGALVQRHLNLVYSVALRQVGGDAHLAQDVAQRVFADLARKAPALSRRATLGGWLYRATQFAANDLVRSERARRAREQEAQLMHELSRDPHAAADWEKLRPVLDVAINELGEGERDAVVLRFFEARPFAEIGATLRVTEDAARMRVERALEKLRTALARRGVTSTGTALAAVLANQLNMAAPAGLAATVTGAAMAGSAAGTGAAAVLVGMTKIQIGIAGALAASFATAYVVQGNTNAGLQREISALAPPPQAVAALRAENRQLATTTAEVEMLRRDDLELKQLEQRVAKVKKANEERTRLASAAARVRQQFYDRIRADDARAQQEIDRLNREGNALVNDYKALVAKSKDAAQTPEARAEAEAAAKAKLDVIKLKQQEIQAFTQNVRKALAQRVEAFRRANGDDPNMPAPAPQVGAGRLELRRVPANDAGQWTSVPPPGNGNPP